MPTALIIRALRTRATSGPPLVMDTAQPFCPNQKTDLMSYAYRAAVHNNSQIDCSDGWPAGDRSYADSAYHLNRVRYDVSMIGVESLEDSPPRIHGRYARDGPVGA